MERSQRLFVYGTFLHGEREHETLAGAELLGEIATAPGYRLVELDTLAALVESTIDGAVVGEVYALDAATLARCDVVRDCPRLYHRKVVRLADGSEAQAYFVEALQVRGRRRVRGGDWRKRFSSQAPDLHEAGPFVRWSRSRWSQK
jgi:gamma-glutamylaminecyclotransferase